MGDRRRSLPLAGPHAVIALGALAPFGRFLSVDPIISNPMNSQSLNPYSYIGNNPLSGTDPTGYCAEGSEAKTGSHICQPTQQGVLAKIGDALKSGAITLKTSLEDASKAIGTSIAAAFPGASTAAASSGNGGGTTTMKPNVPASDTNSPAQVAGRSAEERVVGREQLPPPPVWDPAKRMAQGLMMMVDPSYGFWPTSTDGDAYIAHVNRRLAQGRQDFALGAFELALIFGSLLPGAGAAEGAVLARAEASFAGTPAEILQGMTSAQNARLAANPALASTVLSPAEYAADQASAKVAQLAYGNAVERLVAIEARSSSPALFQHLGGAGRPDFLGVGRAAGMSFDITTAGQVASHLARPYGPGITIVTYQRPLTFTVFPQ